jgi:predicted transcriptional regulator
MDDIHVGSPQAIAEMNRRHLSIAFRMQAVAVAALEEWERKIAAGEPLNVSAEDAKALLDAGREMERSALGGNFDSPKKLN